MAKGRKHSSSDRHDRLLGTYGYANGHVPITDQQDLGEDDVWLTSSFPQSSDGTWTGSEPGQTNSDRSSRTSHWDRTDHRHVGGLSLAFGDGYRTGPTAIHQYSNLDSPTNGLAGAAALSAPVNVPNWSKMVRVDSTDSMSCSGELDHDESEWVPPHEYLAREHGRSVATSVLEGVGRTLKGRDMSRVRDAVWSKTGFFG